MTLIAILDSTQEATNFRNAPGQLVPDSFVPTLLEAYLVVAFRRTRTLQLAPRTPVAILALFRLAQSQIAAVSTASTSRRFRCRCIASTPSRPSAIFCKQVN